MTAHCATCTCTPAPSIAERVAAEIDRMGGGLSVAEVESRLGLRTHRDGLVRTVAEVETLLVRVRADEPEDGA